MEQTSVWIVYQTLISAVIGGVATGILWSLTRFFNERQKKYERRYALYKALISNVRNVLSFEFVAAYNMLLVEFKKDKAILEARDKFLNCVNRPITENVEQQKRNADDFDDALVRLIDAVGKSIGIKMDQMDIKNKIYMPRAFADNEQTQRDLITLNKSVLEGWNILLKRLNDAYGNQQESQSNDKK